MRVGIRTAVTGIGFLAALFCFVEGTVGALIAYTAYQRDSLRGVPFHVYARNDALLFIAAVVLFRAAVKVLRKPVG